MTVNPSTTMRLVAAHLPAALHERVLLVGSLAAAYHYRDQLPQEVTTKDADVIIQPAGELGTCRDVAFRLLDAGWVHQPDPTRPPGQHSNALNLPAVRLHPPDGKAYFLELLAMPDRGQTATVVWSPIQLSDGWYGVPSFRFMRVLSCDQETGERGLRYAAPSMMALANALSHPELGEQRISRKIWGKSILRSAKDLGRVLGIARLEARAVLETWPATWLRALRSSYPDEWRTLAPRACSGLRALVRDEQAFEEAHLALSNGLLSKVPLTVDNLRAVSRQFEQDVLMVFEGLLREHSAM